MTRTHDHATHRRCASLATAVMILTLSAGAAHAATIASHRLTYNIHGNIVQLPYHTNNDHADLTTPNALVTRAVIVLHGVRGSSADRAAETVYNNMCKGLRKSEPTHVPVDADGDGEIDCPKASEGTLIIAPQFLDADATLPAGLFYWHSNGWAYGNQAETGLTPGLITSYDMLDRLVRILSGSGSFNNLKEIVIAGQSGGGQLANRYAAANSAEPYAAARGVKVRYIVANPSSYLYFNAWRVTPGTDQFSTYDASQCTSFNNYHYGLNFTGYDPTYIRLRGITNTQLRTNYRSRNVSILLGELDNDRCDDGMSTTCAANAQGPTRLERGLNYYTYLGLLFGSGVYSKHRLEVVPGVGHGSYGIYNSTVGLRYIFKYGSVRTAAPVPMIPWITPGDTTPTFKWYGLPAAEGYQVRVYRAALPNVVYRSWSPTRHMAQCPYGGRCSFTPTTIALPAGSYTFSVRAAINGSYTQTFSDRVPFVVGRPAPPALVSPKGNVINDSRPPLVWKAVPGVSSYTVTVEDTSGRRRVRTIPALLACRCGLTCQLAAPFTFAWGKLRWWVQAHNVYGDSGVKQGSAYLILRL